MVNSEGQDRPEIEVANQHAGRDSTIFQLAQQLLDEADRLARGVTEEAKRDADAETVRILSEAQRRAEEILEAASDRAKRIESDAREAIKKMTDGLREELEAAVSTLAKLSVQDSELSNVGTLAPHGPERTEDKHQAALPPGLQGHDGHSQAVSPGSR